MHDRVTAVVVAHNGASYLPQTLKALSQQTRSVDFYFGVDAGSDDASASMLQLQLPVGSPVLASSGKAGFGSAVETALAELRPAGSDNDHPVQEWIWLIHDDGAPEPRALEELLLAVERAPSVTVAGAKQVEWESPRKLVDVGLSISRWAERLTLIDTDELDQGQYDGRSDVFAVNSSGMLVRRDVWEKLDGFDPAFPGSGDDVDFCWRNRLAGHRVVVVPSAVVRHRGHRPNQAAGPRSARKAEVFLRLKHSPLWMVPFLALGAILGGTGRFLIDVLAKRPGHGLGQLVASIAATCRPIQLYRSRRSAARTRRLSRKLVRGLTTERREVWAHRRSLLESLSAGSVVGDGTGSDDGGTYVPSGDATDDFTSLAAPSRVWAGAGAVAAAAILAAVSLVAMFRFIGAPALAGGALLPLSKSAAALWNNATSWWVSVGSGIAGHGDSFDYVLWLFALMGGGNGSTAVVVFIFLLLPLAGLSAWIAAGAFTQRRALRFWAAMFWASVPALQVAMGTGRLGAMVAHLLLPLAALGMVRAVGGARPRASMATHRANSPDVVLKPGINGVPSWTAAAAAGLVLAIITAGAPVLFLFMVVAVALIMVASGRKGRTLWWSLLPSLAVFAPSVLAAFQNPRALLADPGRAIPFEAASPWQQLLGYPVAFDPFSGLSLPGPFADSPWALVAALVIGAPVLLLAAAGLFRFAARSGMVRVLWVLAALAVALSAVTGQVATALGSGFLVTAFPGSVVSVLVLLLLTAALITADGYSASMQAQEGWHYRRTRLTAVVVGLVLAAGPVTSLAVWTIPQLSGPDPVAEKTTLMGTAMGLESHTERILPATAADKGTSAQHAKTLQLRVSDTGTYRAVLMSGGGTTMDQLSGVYSALRIDGPPGSETVREADGADQALREVVAAITGASGVDPRQTLRALGIGFVVLQETDTAAELVASRIDAVPGLNAVGKTSNGWLWRVAGPLEENGTETLAWQTGHVRIVDGEGATLALVGSGRDWVDTTIGEGTEERRLVLAERFDSGWHATLNGKELPAEAADWAQSFELPATGGDIRVNFVTPWEPWVYVGQIILIGLTLLLAIPVPARRRHPSRIPGRSGLHDKRAHRDDDAANYLPEDALEEPGSRRREAAATDRVLEDERRAKEYAGGREDR
ncbi:glycosyltransferase family 2 protein [Arthrobacter roseus]|uniref:glycosyltransferase family 2 protein n=1 Tax=Arthrobacter roseus TaxID=136274 RepID=UPI001963D266|nr:glycosyltransferase family 2 protein [Arthrobacter roseus]